MKKHVMMAAMVLLAASCSNEIEESVNNQNEQATAPVSVRVSDFSISMDEMSSEGMTRAAQNPADYFKSGGAAMTLAFYDTEGNEIYKTTQLKSETPSGFGTFTANLPIGHYTMVALGRYYADGDVFTLTSPTEAGFTSERPRETFCATQEVTVTSTTPLDLDVTLNRISARLTIHSTDGRTASATKIRTTFTKGGRSFSPTTGLATEDTGFSQTNTPTTAVGVEIGATCYPFLATDEETMNVTIEALDDDNNVLFTKVVNNVPFKRNYVTNLQGAIYTASASTAAFKVETTYGEGETINF